jgi:3-methyladenine DNA glycosylase/8-oxoguanine DNA glycosylase
VFLTQAENCSEAYKKSLEEKISAQDVAAKAIDFFVGTVSAVLISLISFSTAKSACARLCSSILQSTLVHAVLFCSVFLFMQFYL